MQGNSETVLVREEQKKFDLKAKIVKVWNDSSSNKWVVILTKSDDNKV